MGSPTTSTRGVITSRTVVSRRSWRAARISRSWSCPASTLRLPRPGRDPGGRSSGELSRRRNTSRNEWSGSGNAAGVLAVVCPADDGQDGHGLEGLVVERSAFGQGGRRLAEPDRVEWFHDPALRARALGEEDVGAAI